MHPLQGSWNTIGKPVLGWYSLLISPDVRRVPPLTINSHDLYPPLRHILVEDPPPLEHFFLEYRGHKSTPFKSCDSKTRKWKLAGTVEINAQYLYYSVLCFSTSLPWKNNDFSIISNTDMYYFYCLDSISNMKTSGLYSIEYAYNTMTGDLEVNGITWPKRGC